MDKTNRWMVGRKTKLFKKQMVGWMDGQKNKQIDTKMEDWMDRKIWMVGQIKIDEKIDGWLDGYKKNRWMVEWIHIFFKQIVGWMDRIPQKNGWMDRQMNSRMDIKNRCMVGWT